MPRRSTRAAPAPVTAASAPDRRASARLSTAQSPSASRKRKSSSASSPSRSRKTAKSTARQIKYFKQETAEDSESGSDYVSEAPDAASEAESTGDKELWREGVKTGLGPGKEVFIKKPKMRDPGNVPYRDEALHPNTLLFLQDLAQNNEREWFKVHDAEYRAAKKDWETFVESLSGKIMEQDATIPELPAKDLIFRIHRDARFSKNPAPYKAHFAAAWSRTGKKGPYAAYYVHFQPGSCFVGSGLWMPETDKLAVIREEIDQHSDRLKAILVREDMRRDILDGVTDDTDAAVKAFVSQNKESALKVKPKGYDVDNENIQLLRLRSFTMGKAFSDAEIMDANAQEKIAAAIGVMEPFVTYLNSVVMPDPADDDSGSDSDSSGQTAGD